MSNEKEMTAEEYKEKFDNGLLAFASDSLKTYGDLRAKEAVKEFAVVLLNAISDLDAQNAIILELRKRKLM